jgi:hypothetical protein
MPTKEPSVPPALQPEPPDLGHQVVRFLAWLKKRGAVKSLAHCKKKWKDLEVEATAKRLEPARIAVYASSRGDKVVVLKDTVWADRWMIYYGEEIPHHGQAERTRI